MKKKLFPLFSTLVFFLILFSIQGLAYSDTDIAYEVTGGNLYFDSDTGTITDCDAEVSEAIIPAQINGVSVTSIGAEAFKDHTVLNSVTIPDSVTSIADYAFYGCSGLLSVDLPNDLNRIGEYAFYGCSSLSAIDFPESLNDIGKRAFQNCESLTEAILPSKITVINDYLFANCFSLTSVSIPQGVTSIGRSSFYYCSSLPSITLPHGIESFDQFTFAHCHALSAINIPTSLNDLGDKCFAGCKQLRMTFEGSAPTMGSRSFQYATAILYYHGSDASWSDDVRWDYGATDLTWTPYYQVFSGDDSLLLNGSGIAYSSEDYKVGLISANLNTPPENITVTVGEYTLVSNLDYTYHAASGEITIFAKCITDDINIIASPTPAEDLVFFNESLSLQSYIGFNFMVKNEILAEYDSWYVIFERYDADTGLLTETVSGTDFSASYKQFEYKVYSYQMSDDVTATLYAVKDGVTYMGETYTSSVRDYAYGKFSASTDEAYKTLLANLLKYGETAQIYRPYKADDLATSVLSAEEQAYITATVPSVTNRSASTNKGLSGVTLSQNALGIASAVQIQFVTKIADTSYTASDLYAVVSWNHKGTAMTKRIEGSDFVKMGNFYTIIFEDLCAYEGRVSVELTVYNTEGVAVSETWTYSIESYVAYRQGIATPEATMNTLNALMNYYDSADAYFN